MKASTQLRIMQAQWAKERATLKAENVALQKDLSGALDRLDRKVRRVNVAPPARFRPNKGDIKRAICCDLHGAKMDPAAAGAFLADCKKLEPDEVWMLGDMMDCGGFLAQHHVWGYVAETDYTYEDDIASTNRFLDDLRAACPNARIHYIEGNHEQRVERWCVTQALRSAKDSEGLRRRNAPEYLLGLKEREIPYYRMSQCYDGLDVPGTVKRGKCFMTHGSFVTSKHATARIQSVVSGNVVYANTHRRQDEIVRRLSVGVVGAWNPGCLCLLQPLWQNTNPTDWSHGYGIQFISARTGNFLHLNIPIVNGNSLMVGFLEKAA